MTMIVRLYTEPKPTVLNSWYVKTMSVRREGKTGIFPLEMGLRIKISRKPDVSSSIPINLFISYNDSLFTAMTLTLYKNQVHSSGVKQ